MTAKPVPTLVRVEGLRKSYRTAHGSLKALDGISLQIASGETLAVVGESGCGKSTLAMVLLGLTTFDAGSIAFDGNTVIAASGSARMPSRRDVGVVFQNPHSSLNPKMKVRSIVGEPLVTVFAMRGKSITMRVSELLGQVGLGPEYLERYPHQLSGGQMQRVAIARALALKPRLLVLDEPTAALDVSVQAQILNLLRSLQAETAVSYLFITHDLGAADYLAHKVMVMYLGRVVESGPANEVFARPRHPYSQALLDAVPVIDLSRRGRFAPLDGEVPSPLHRPKGCAFAPRCCRATVECHKIEPELSRGEEPHSYACFHPLPLKASDHSNGKLHGAL